ncbi:MAG: hypothetical protein WCJ30_07375 [Deltaproteobacteria bacterium]
MPPSDSPRLTPSPDLTSKVQIRDPYADLLRDTRGLRREQAAAREAWFASLNWESKEETLFELEMLMKGLVCFANPRNHPGPSRKSPVVALDFRDEAVVARQCVGRIVSLCRLLLGSKDRGFVFTRYLESVMLEDPARARLNRDSPVQEGPEDSLLHLRHALTVIAEVMDGLLRLERIPYRLFHATLVMAQREIQRNQFFNPLIALEFRPEFDRIRSVEVLEAISSIQNDQAHRVVALAYLACFRILRYAQLIQTTAADPGAVRRAYVLLAVMRSDARAIIGFLRERAAGVLADGFERELMKVPANQIQARFDALARESSVLAAVRGTLEAIAAAMRVEVRGIFEVKVPSPNVSPTSADLARALTVSMTGLRETVQAGITQLTITLRGDTDPAKIFDDIEARRATGERLRRDVWMFAQVLRAFIAKARATPETPDLWAGYSSFQFVREFLGYFRAMGYQLLRASDYPNFDQFLVALDGLHESDFLEPARMHAAITECEGFQKYLVDTFNKISLRTELQGVAFDKRGAAETLRLYLGT